MPRPSAAASRAGVQMQGFHPTVCGLPSASEWPKGHCAGLCLNNEADTRSSCPTWWPSVPGLVADQSLILLPATSSHSRRPESSAVATASADTRSDSDDLRKCRLTCYPVAHLS
jgi:hypothetical protein